LKDLFASKGKNISGQKISVVPNGYDEEDFILDKPMGSNDIFTICYTGSMTDQYDPGIFLRAFKELADLHGEKVRLKMIGSISPGIIRYIKELAIEDYLEMHPLMPHKEAIAHMQRADALLLLIPDVEQAELILTGKLFEYLAAGKPIIMLGPTGGDAAEIIRECKAGSSFDRQNQKALVLYLEELWSRFQQGETLYGDKTAVRSYSREEQAKKVKEIVQI